jgi:ABC-2 type transport system permease protein
VTGFSAFSLRHELTGLGPVVRLVIRRDRWRLAIWALGLLVIQIASAFSLIALYGDDLAVQSYVTLFGDNPALVVFAGPGYGFDDPNIGVVLVNETQLWGGIALGLMSIFLIVRSTRAEEDSERIELLGSSVVGRHAPATAAVIVVAGTQTLISVVTWVGYVIAGFAPLGSAALAASMMVVGWVMLALALVAAQIFGSSRAALSAAALTLVLAFIIRAIGDVTGNGMQWLSPIGWAQGVRAFADERWWTLMLSAGVACALVAISFRLASVRDLGSGMVPARPGRAHASGVLIHPIGMVLRLQKGSIIGWSIGMLALGMVFGSIADDVELMLVNQPELSDFFAQLEGVSLLDSYLATAGVFMGLLAGGYAVATVLGAHSEERAGRAELLWAGPVDRRLWFGRYLAVMFVGSLWMLICGGFGLGLAYAVVIGDFTQILAMILVAMASAPAVWVLAGCAAVLWGLRPGWAMWAWAPVTVAVLVGYFAELLRLPSWVRSISPYEHLAAVPMEPFNWVSSLTVTAVSGALVALSLWGVRRRDLATY